MRSLTEILTEAQIAALEKAKADTEAHGKFDSECPGYGGAQATFNVGTLNGVGPPIPGLLPRTTSSPAPTASKASLTVLPQNSPKPRGLPDPTVTRRSPGSEPTAI